MRGELLASFSFTWFDRSFKGDVMAAGRDWRGFVKGAIENGVPQ